MEAGRYSAVTIAATVYVKNDKLILGVTFNVEGHELNNFWVVGNNDGSVDKENIAKLREWATDWNGVDPYWWKDNAGNHIPCEVTVKLEPGFRDPNRLYPKIKWVDRVGGEGNKLPPMTDRKAVLSRWGSGFRASAGPQPVGIKPTREPDVPAALPPTRAPVKTAPVSTEEEPWSQSTCWALMQSRFSAMEANAVTDLWFEIIGERDQTEMTDDEWADVATAIGERADQNDKLPF